VLGATESVPVLDRVPGGIKDTAGVGGALAGDAVEELGVADEELDALNVGGLLSVSVGD